MFVRRRGGGKRAAVNEVRDHDWRKADAFEREKMVRKACAWRVIGKVVGAAA
jgi:hypothetical protein